MKTSSKLKKISIVTLLVLIICYIIYAFLRSLPALDPIVISNRVNKLQVPPYSISWAQSGEQAIGVQGYGVLATSGAQQPVPIASIAKVMVALAVMQSKPLALNQQGPYIPITAKDVLIYQEDLADGQSVVALQAGEKITEYQALEAMLLPSANNMATTLSSWAFGSLSGYLNFANNYAKNIGMENTYFGDASGFMPNTTSTPSDLVKLGELALQNPVIKKIVGEYSANLPVVGQVTNIDLFINPSMNSVLNGIKTGNTTQAGGCFLYSAPFHNSNIVGVILGATSLGNALYAGPQVEKSAASNIEINYPVKNNQVFGFYKLPWGGRVNVVAQQDLSVASSNGTQIPVNITIKSIKNGKKAANVGNVKFEFNHHIYNSPLILVRSIPKPNLWWRLVHP